ncbi:MAG: hypothetical protein HUU35_03865 [Armatimonadetes bacterium]|nr:hypothetical protein [Armatimonadota bacterium]
MRARATTLVWLAMVPLACGAAQLRYRLAAGEETRYHETVTAKGNLTVSSMLGEQVLPVEVKAVEERALKTVELLDNGTAWVESHSLSGTATVTVMGESSQEELPGLNLRMRMDPLGNILESKQLESTQRGSVGLDLHLESLLQAARLTAFPQEEVEVGARWDKVIELPTADGRTITARASSRLVGMRQVDGVAMAEIESTYEVPIPKTDGKVKLGGMELPVQVEGSTTGKTLTLWDIARGRSHSMKGDGTVDLKLLLVGLSTEPSVGKFALDLEVRLQP